MLVAIRPGLQIYIQFRLIHRSFNKSNDSIVSPEDAIFIRQLRGRRVRTFVFGGPRIIQIVIYSSVPATSELRNIIVRESFVRRLIVRQEIEADIF